MRSFSGGSNDRLRVKPGENAVVDFARGVRRSGFLLVAANLVPLFRFLKNPRVGSSIDCGPQAALALALLG